MQIITLQTTFHFSILLINACKEMNIIRTTSIDVVLKTYYCHFLLMINRTDLLFNPFETEISLTQPSSIVFLSLLFNSPISAFSLSNKNN